MNSSRSAASEKIGTLRDSKFSVASKLLLRVFRHITRRTALVAIILGCVAALLAILVGPATSVGQVMLVAMGIFVSVVVLPEAPYRMWNVRPVDLAETVPSDHLLEASRTIAKAIDMQSRRSASGNMLPSNLIPDIWGEALQNLIDIIDDPSRVVCNLDYSARIDLAAGKPCHRVNTTIRAERHLPRTTGGFVWFSFCSDMVSLAAEFDQHSEGCIARELIPMREGEDSESWYERVDGYIVRFDINGIRENPLDTERIKTNNGLIYRKKFASGALADSFVSTELWLEFELSIDIGSFPVKFAAYSVFGTASVTMELVGQELEMNYDEYLSPANRKLAINSDYSDRSWLCTIRTSGQTVVPSGAGVIFSWSEC